MRSIFFQTLADLAAQDNRIVLLTGDLGYRALEPFSEKFPDRFINAGVAEQNMVGMATGLAEAGFIPFVYSIAPFAVLRPFEFIRNGPVAHRFPVRIVGMGGGVEYSHNGISHFGLEDIAVLRTQPGLTILAPADPPQAETILRATWNLPGPVYYRLGKDDQALIPALGGRFAMDRFQILREGDASILFALGNIAREALVAADILATRGISITVAVAAALQPAPIQDIVSRLRNIPTAFSVEAHSTTGGLGSLIAECAAEQGLGCRIVRFGITGMPDGITGSQQFLYHRYGITPEQLAERIQRTLEAEDHPHGTKTH
jgi:transketolase